MTSLSIRSSDAELEKESVVEQDGARSLLLDDLKRTESGRATTSDRHSENDEREELEYARQYEELDRHVLSRIEAAYGPYLDGRTRDTAERVSSRFPDHERYQMELDRAYPSMSESERAVVIGDLRNGIPVIDRNQPTVAITAAHERLHQLASPEFRTRWGQSLDEGTTGLLSKRLMGDLFTVDCQDGYLNHEELVQMMGARVGEDALLRAYFRGDDSKLVSILDHDLGAEATARLRDKLRSGDLDEARRILLGH
jgi:hypothetical protein